MASNGVLVNNNNIYNNNGNNHSIGSQMALKWDPKNLEIRTHSVEKTLEPLVMQVCVGVDVVVVTFRHCLDQ